MNYDCTVVTAFYSIPSKFNVAKYLEWSQYFLQINAPILLFTEEALAPMFEALRPADKPMHIITQPFDSLDTWKLYRDQWITMHAIDHEKAIHSPQLYAIWAQKAWWVEKAITLNPFRTDYFFWCDIGAFRGTLPHPSFPQVRHFHSDKILLSSVAPLTLEERKKGYEADFTRENRIVGGLWGGGKQGCLKWKAAFQTMLETYFNSGRFAGKDQSVMLSAYLVEPTLAIVVKPTHQGSDPWFFLEYLLSNQAPFVEDESYLIKDEKKMKVSVSIKGGLGNQMFQIATAYAFAKRVGAELILPKEKIHPDSRPQKYWDTALSGWSSHLVDTLTLLLPSMKRIEEQGPTKFTQLPDSIQENTYLEGYWQSSKYFRGAESEIRQRMLVTPTLAKTIQEKWGWILKNKERVVVVHARRTDYLAAAAFHGPLTAEYYKEAIEKMLEVVKDPLFLLVSDDQAFWSEIRPQIPALQTCDSILLQSATDVETLGLLQQFEYFIMANSTFSWWFTWLANAKCAIAPAKWFGPTGPKPHEYEDIYEPNWIRI